MIKIDVDTRCWKIPKEECFLGVESDDKVRILQFELSKNEFCDGLNFTDCNCFINYKNEGNDTIPYGITDMEVQEDGTVTFTWEVSRGATIFKGNTFAVLCAKKVREDGTITNEWNSRIGSFTVSKGLEPSSSIVEVPEIDIISQLLLVAQQTNTNAQNNINQSSSLLEKAEGLGYLKEEYDVLEARMNQFTSLQEGSTTGDAELIDGRIGYDGTVHDNIGGAIRGQISELKGDLDDIRYYYKNVSYGADNCPYNNIEAPTGLFFINNYDLAQKYTMIIDLELADNASGNMSLTAYNGGAFVSSCGAEIKNNGRNVLSFEFTEDISSANRIQISVIRNAGKISVKNIALFEGDIDEISANLYEFGNKSFSVPLEYNNVQKNNNDIGILKDTTSKTISYVENLNYGHGVMPTTYSTTSAMWDVPYSNPNNKEFTVKLGIDRVDGYIGGFAIRLQARKAGNAHIDQIDSYIPNDVSQNDIVLHYDFGDTDLSGITNFCISAIFLTSGSITVKYFGLFEGNIDDCSDYTDNAERMYIVRIYSKNEVDSKIEKVLNDSKSYTDSKFDTVVSSNKNNGTEKPLFDLFGDYGNRDVKIVMVGDSTTDGIEGAGAGLYSTFKLYQCSGELLEGAVIVDKGANGAMASGYADGYESETGKLYDAVKENGDLYIVSLGLNDIRDTDITSQIIADRLSYIVDAILRDTKGKVILRVPNPFREDFNVVPSMTAQECTNTIYDAYMLIKNKWAKDKVRMLDMQELIFGKNVLPLDSDILMNDSTHPKGRTNASWYNRDEFGLNKVARVIAEAIGRKPIMTESEYRKLVFDGEENDFQNHPMLLDYNSGKYQLIKDELTFGGMGTNYLDIWAITPEELSVFLKKGDIVKLGNKNAFIYDGIMGDFSGNTRLGGQTYPVVCSMDEVATVSIYREIS